MKKIYPPKLKRGDEVRVIAPSTSLAIVPEGVRHVANARIANLGLRLSFGDHVNESDAFRSSPVASRVHDLHAAFADPQVKAVIAVIGGYNCNQLLRYLDWSLIRKNPKIFCGFSDITVMNNAILSKTGLVTYYGPMYNILGQELHFDYTLDHFVPCFFEDAPLDLNASDTWSDDKWYRDQKDRHLIPNEGYWVLNEGNAAGSALGGGITSLRLLQGTEYFPDMADSILFLEDDIESGAAMFDRNLQSLLHLPAFAGVRGIVIGRFQKACKMTRELLTAIVKTKPELDDIPVIANADFGHTSPIFTFPVGGEVDLQAHGGEVKVRIMKH